MDSPPPLSPPPQPPLPPVPDTEPPAIELLGFILKKNNLVSDFFLVSESSEAQLFSVSSIYIRLVVYGY